MGSSVYWGEFDSNVEKKDVLFVNSRDECCLGNDNLMMWPCSLTLWRKSNKTSVGPKTMSTFRHTHNLHAKMCHLDTARQVDRYSLGGYWSHTFITNKSVGMFSPTSLPEHLHSRTELTDGLNLYQTCRQLKRANEINRNQYAGHTSIKMIDILSEKRYGRPQKCDLYDWNNSRGHFMLRYMIRWHAIYNTWEV